MERIVIVGASLAALRAAETLRGDGFEGSVTLVGAEPHRPYDRPPLSKKLLAGEWEADRVPLRTTDSFDALDVGWRLGVAATGLDLPGRTVTLADGDEVSFDGLVLACGARPKALPGVAFTEPAAAADARPFVTALRTLDDSLALRSRLASGDQRVVVIGAGFIGLEVAATARGLGNDVVVLEGASAPLIRALGAEMGTAMSAFHADHGVEIRCDVRVDGVDASGVRLATADGVGEVVPADVVVVGIGVEPATDWLEDCGLELRDGIVCDATLAARGAPEGVPVFAAGDVARWPNGLFDEEMRIEHWTNAAEQGLVAAKALLAVAGGEEPEPYSPVPFFWSDQYDRRIQFVGRASPDDDVEIVSGSVDDRKFLALFGREGRLRGALGLNLPKLVMPYRALLEERISWDDALARVD
jgi:NADPH-dependent 2,4-dienoyl-CoA reductase/sulfur reductase-like enzyme